MSTSRIVTGLPKIILTEEEQKKLQQELKAEEAQHQEVLSTLKSLKPVYSKEQINTIIAELSGEIAEDMRKKENVVVMTVLSGAMDFSVKLKNLLLKQGLAPKEDVIRVTRYGENHQPGPPVLDIKPKLDLRGRNVYIIEDLTEGGGTAAYSKQVCLDLGAASVKVVVLIDRVNLREEEYKDFNPDFIGMVDPVDKAKNEKPKWLIGVGLDEYRRGRSLSWIGEKVIVEQDQAQIDTNQAIVSTPQSKM